MPVDEPMRTAARRESPTRGASASGASSAAVVSILYWPSARSSSRLPIRPSSSAIAVPVPPLSAIGSEIRVTSFFTSRSTSKSSCRDFVGFATATGRGPCSRDRHGSDTGVGVAPIHDEREVSSTPFGPIARMLDSALRWMPYRL